MKQENRALSFEQALEELEKIVEELETGEVGLEDSLKLYEKGIGLYRLCMKRLEDLQGKIEVLVKELDGSFTRKDFLSDED